MSSGDLHTVLIIFHLSRTFPASIEDSFVTLLQTKILRHVCYLVFCSAFVNVGPIKSKLTVHQHEIVVPSRKSIWAHEPGSPSSSPWTGMARRVCRGGVVKELEPFSQPQLWRWERVNLINRPLWIYPTCKTIHFWRVLTIFNVIFITPILNNHSNTVKREMQFHKRFQCHSLKWCHRVHHMETHGWQLRRGRQWCPRESQRAFHLPLCRREVHRTQTLTSVSMP